MPATTRASQWARRTLAVLAVLALGTVAQPMALAAQTALPFAKVEQIVAAHFRALPDYRPGAVISRSQVESLFRKLDRLGWAAADRSAILDRVLADDDWLVQTLRTADGQRFAARIATYPEGYDRLDRLSRLANGRRMVQDLIRGPGGYRMIEYMTQSRGGVELGRMLAQAPSGADFNQPTGRIYTVDGLLEQLKKSHQAAK